MIQSSTAPSRSPDPTRAEAGPESPVQPEPSSAASILIVHDHPTARQIVVSLLESRGYRCVEAGTAAEAVRALKMERIDGVLLDIEMPSACGLNTLAQIRAQSSALYVPILMLASNPDSERILAALRGGASDYLVKPLQWELVFARLEIHLARRRAEMEAERLRQRLEQEVAIRTAELKHSNTELRKITQLLRSVGESLPGHLPVSDLAGNPAMRSPAPFCDVGCVDGVETNLAAACLGTSPELASARLAFPPFESLGTSGEGPAGQPGVHPPGGSRNGDGAPVPWSDDIARRGLSELAVRESQKLESLGLLTAGLVHDLKNMLQVVRGFVLLALRDAQKLGPGPHAALEGNLREVLDATESTDGLLRQMLAFSSKSQPQPKWIDIDCHCANRLRMMQLAVGKAVTVAHKAGAGTARILADPGMLDQVLLNLALNAGDAMPDGGSLTIETVAHAGDDPLGTAHGVPTDNRFVRIAIRDTGIGMSPEVRDRLFEPFFTTKSAGHGTGLGLFVVHGIVAQHQGHMVVESTPSQGSVFHIYWPMA